MRMTIRALTLLLIAAAVTAFIVTPLFRNMGICRLTTALSSSSLPPNFNPLDKHQQHQQHQQQSLRDMQMQSLMAQLLPHANDPAKLQAMLQQQQEFWKQPWDHVDPILRAQQHQKYLQTLTQRIAQTKSHRPAHQVLIAVRELVISMAPSLEEEEDS